MQTGIKNPMQEELISKLEEENTLLVDEVDKMKKDQEELLELLAEQDSKIIKLRMQLKSLGIEVSVFEHFFFIQQIRVCNWKTLE